MNTRKNLSWLSSLGIFAAVIGWLIVREFGFPSTVTILVVLMVAAMILSAIAGFLVGFLELMAKWRVIGIILSYKGSRRRR
jgi:1-aminocyclopropane-1-carboxylate deaminase/D-cysteine desulfhydrase-like pyridoxal-dependent ACC family enzyme